MVAQHDVLSPGSGELPPEILPTHQTQGILFADPAEIIGEADTPAIDSYEKFVALHDDPRAGFLPATHREKWIATDLLTFLPAPGRPNNLNHRLERIMFSQQGALQRAGFEPRDTYYDSLRTVQSILNEWGDYLENADQGARQLGLLNTVTADEPSPNVSLSEVLEDLGEAVPDYNFLIRYLDLDFFRRKGLVSGIDPLHVREDRTIVDDVRNKVVEDVYTGGMVSDRMQQYINERVNLLTMKHIRRPVVEAVEDQKSRSRFWKRVLLSVDTDFELYAKEALDRALHV